MNDSPRPNISLPAPGITDMVLTALALSGIARCEMAFREKSSKQERNALLLAAADLLDRTLPYPQLKEQMLKDNPKEPVPYLICNRNLVAVTWPFVWKKLRVNLRDLHAIHYSGFRALDHALRMDFSSKEKSWEIIDKWLAPVWDSYPELQKEAQFWPQMGRPGTYDRYPACSDAYHALKPTAPPSPYDIIG